MGLRGLGTVRVDKEDVIDRLKSNRETHVETYEKAIEGWLEDIHHEALQLVGLTDEIFDEDDFSDDIAEKLNKIMTLRRDKPVNHVADYDRALDMLASSLDEELELSEREFARYMRDDFEWKDSFRMSTAKYT